MAFSQFGTNANARKKRVYYTETSTIYEGMPVCYDYDATTNILGYDKAAGGDAPSQSSPTTTAEGYQNEGKFLRVEDPTDNNIMHFAGVVAGTSYAGLIGPRWLDIYIPNGAIVPVRCDVDTTTGITLLAITVDSQEFGLPVAGTSRIVALAMDTETGLDGTTDITFAKLDDRLSVYQDLDGTALSVGAGSGDIVANRINLTSAQTAGRFCAFEVIAAVTAGGDTESGGSDYGLAAYFQADVTGGTVGDRFAGVGIWTNLTGGTIGEYVCALEVGLYENGCTMTGNGRTSVLTLGCQVADSVTNGFSWIYFHEDGAVAPDYLFEVANINFCSGYASSSNAPALATGDLMIPVRVGGTTYYLVALQDNGSS